jgi:hypothetical protein
MDLAIEKWKKDLEKSRRFPKTFLLMYKHILKTFHHTKT